MSHIINSNSQEKLRLLFDTIALLDNHYSNPEFQRRYLKIDINDNIEYVDSHFIFGEYDSVRCFHYVQIIGSIWQFIFLIKQLYANYGYDSGIRLLINMVGTKATILVDFSLEVGQENSKWKQPLEREFGRKLYGLNMNCPNPNLQMEYNFFLKSMGFPESRTTISDIVKRFGLAYNHQSEPRCFNYKTDIFPWEQFLRNRE